MGDITIYLLIDSTLCGSILPLAYLPSDGSSSKSLALAAMPMTAAASTAGNDIDAAESNDSRFIFENKSHTLPADTSLAELMDFILSQITTASQSHQSMQSLSTAAATSVTTTNAFDKIHKTNLLKQLTILDISYHPPKSISSIIQMNTEQSGPMSKTLQSMGWYPSGKLVILPSPSLSMNKANNNNGPYTNTDDREEEMLLETFIEWRSRNVLQDEEYAYNQPSVGKIDRKPPNDASAKSEGVQWTGAGAAPINTTSENQYVKPSDIFNAVENRFDARDNDTSTQQQHSKKKSNNKRTEKERCKRLDMYLQHLQNHECKSTANNKKKKAVSQKVRTMLLKSRSEGSKKLRMEDRFHLEIVRLVDDGSSNNPNNLNENATSYRFFSRVATVGRVASTIAPSLGNDKAAEFLVSVSLSASEEGGGGTVYKRLPNTMTLHDAQSSGWLQEFDVVMVRIYSIAEIDGNGDYYGPSKSVLDSDVDEEDDSNNDGKASESVKKIDCDVSSTPDVFMVDEESKANSSEMPIKDNSETIQQPQQHLQQRFDTIFQSLDEDNNIVNGKHTKKKPASKQVRNMIMKSKSTGNSKIKQEDRIYFEIILFCDVGTESSCVSSYRFFSKQNDVQHAITASTEDEKSRVEFIVRLDSTSQDDSNQSKEGYIYRKVSTALKLSDAIKQDLVENFGRVLIRVYNEDGDSVPCESIH